MNKSIKVFTMAISATVLLILAACGGEDNGSSSDNSGDSNAELSAKIGVISYLSGAGGAYGEAITNGLKMAQEEINEQGKVNIELVTEDSAGLAEQALSAAQKLINSENVHAIIGPTLSTEMEVVGPVADQNMIPILGTSVTVEGIPEIGEYVFRNSIPESMAIPAAVEAAVEAYDAEKVAIIYGNDDVLTKAGYDAMKQSAEDLGLEVVTTQTFQLGQSDYKAQLAAIKNADADLVLASALYNEGAVIMTQARAAGIDVPFVGGNGFNSPQLIEIAGDAADGLVVATPWFTEKDDEAVQEFVKKYKEEYGVAPDQFAAQAYDGLYMFAEALERAGEAEPTKLRDALAETNDFNGVLGDVAFDEVGDIVMDPVVLTIKDSEFIEFK